jgi:hypothetical protein
MDRRRERKPGYLAASLSWKTWRAAARETLPMTLNDLTVDFSHLDRNALLDDWRWLIGPDRQAILLTAAGDAFVQDATDESVHFLDVAAGKMQPVAPSENHFRSLLGDRNFVVEFFVPRLVADLKQAGCVLGAGQIYSFRRPPVLGGEYALSNIEPSDIAVHFSIAGQIHRQVSALPAGTPVGQIRIG